MIRPSPPEIFGKKLYEIEHAIDIYAYSYVQFPAAELYNRDLVALHQEIIDKCHIYLIGYVPVVKLIDAEQRGTDFLTKYEVAGIAREVLWSLPVDGKLRREGEKFWVETQDGQRIFPSTEKIIERLHQDDPILFDVQYIGQAYGDRGSRNAHDRLIKHETLQRIALTECPEGQRLEILLIEIQPANRMITVFNPWAENRDEDGSRIANGLDRLFDTTEQEQIALYEAALIRYFQPRFNKEFKNSFPSTNLKLLSQCYEKDMAGVVAEFCFDAMPLFLKSATVVARPYHIAAYNIHGRADRDIFFGRAVGDLVHL